MSSPAQQLVQIVLDGHHWTESESRAFFQQVVHGEVDPLVLSAALAALRVRGPSPAELGGAAEALLESATPFPRPEVAFADIVGTGGDGLNTLNLSTLAAILASACGLTIVKHGNRSVTSRSGSFDLLESLEIPFSLTPEESRGHLDRFGICFLFAPRYHAGLRHAAPVRAALGGRTLFNLLGPLVNPARPPKILLGVADPRMMETVADTLQTLGCEHGLVVHGGGADEIAVHAPTDIIEVQGPNRRRWQVTPEDFGAELEPLDGLVCADAAESHERARNVLAGAGSHTENVAVSLNVAMLLYLFGHEDLKNNFEMALETLQKGEAGALVGRIAGNIR